MDSRYELGDVIFKSVEMNEPFSDVQLVTTRSAFIEKVHSKVPHSIQRESWQYDVAFRSIADSGVMVDEFVDNTTTPPTICVNVDYITEDTVYIAAKMYAAALEQLNGSTGRVTFTRDIRFGLSDITHLINWH